MLERFWNTSRFGHSISMIFFVNLLPTLPKQSRFQGLKLSSKQRRGLLALTLITISMNKCRNERINKMLFVLYQWLIVGDKLPMRLLPNLYQSQLYLSKLDKTKTRRHVADMSQCHDDMSSVECLPHSDIMSTCLACLPDMSDVVSLGGSRRHVC